MNKYRAIRTEVDGHKFPSRREAERYRQLKLLQRAGHISHLELQPAFKIYLNDQLICKVILDFKYWDNDKRCAVYEDSKGCDNPMSKLKRKLVEAQEDIKVHIV
jgi:hypothetical protein